MSSMILYDMVSVTTLRKDTKGVLAKAKKSPQLILNNNELDAVVISPEEFKHYLRIMDQLDIIRSTEEAEKNWPFFKSWKEAIAYLDSLD